MWMNIWVSVLRNHKWNYDCRYMKIVYVQCCEETNIRDPRSHKHYWTSSWNKTWKKFRPVRDLNPWPLRYRCSALPTVTQLNDQLPVGLLTQLVERCTGIAEVRVQIPYGPEFFPGIISTTSSVVFIAARISYIRHKWNRCNRQFLGDIWCCSYFIVLSFSFWWNFLSEGVWICDYWIAILTFRRLHDELIQCFWITLILLKLVRFRTVYSVITEERNFLSL